MPQTVVREDAGTEDCRLSLLNMDCRSCKCLRRRPYTTGCIRATRRADRRAEHRPHVLFWRPWTQSGSRKLLPQGSTQKYGRLRFCVRRKRWKGMESRSDPYAKGLCENRQAGQKPVDYNHPVRLFWPRSKPLDLMYVEADDLLRNFPVQATLSLYDSESDTDNDDENSEEENDSGFESE